MISSFLKFLSPLQFFKTVLTRAVLALCLAASAVPPMVETAAAAPLAALTTAQEALPATQIDQTRYRRYRHYHHRYFYGPRRYYRPIYRPIYRPFYRPYYGVSCRRYVGWHRSRYGMVFGPYRRCFR